LNLTILGTSTLDLGFHDVKYKSYARVVEENDQLKNDLAALRADLAATKNASEERRVIKQQQSDTLSTPHRVAPRTKKRNIHRPPLSVAAARAISHTRPNPKFRFFDLPVELQLLVLEKCLVVGKVFPRPRPEDDTRFEHCEDYAKPQTQLFGVSWEMREKAAKVYFRGNMFVISYGRSSWPWPDKTQHLGERTLRHYAKSYLRRLSVCFDVRDSQEQNLWLQLKPVIAKMDHHDDDDGGVDRVIEGHDQADAEACDTWLHRSEEYSLLKLDLLEVDLEKAYCPTGACRIPMTAVLWDYLEVWSKDAPTVIRFKNVLDEIEVEILLRYLAETDFLIAEFEGYEGYNTVASGEKSP